MAGRKFVKKEIKKDTLKGSFDFRRQSTNKSQPKGAPDIQELRKKIKEEMKKFREPT
jgi:hypothetical protein